MRITFPAAALATVTLACAPAQAPMRTDLPEDLVAARGVVIQWSRKVAAGQYDSLAALAAPDWRVIEGGKSSALPEYIGMVRGLHADSIRVEVDSTTAHTDAHFGYVQFTSHATVWTKGKGTLMREMGLAIVVREGAGWKMEVLIGSNAPPS